MGERSGERNDSRRSFRRLARKKAVTLSLAGLVLLLATAGALAATGDLTQPAGTAGCVSEDGTGPCADGHGLLTAFGVAVSPDSKSVYVASQAISSAVARLDRDTTTGAITQPAGTAGCISDTGAGPCANGHGLVGARSVAVSADGKSVYVASGGTNARHDAVARLDRDTTTGAITQPAGTAGCISETGAGNCANGHGLADVSGLAVSPDGKSVYVATGDAYSVARFNRNTTTGAITQPAGTAGCISETGAGPCADGHALKGPMNVAVSADGKSVYAASEFSSAVVRLNRNTTTGAISQPAGSPGCISASGSGGTCANGHALGGPWGVAVSPDGKSVYVASYASDAVARLNRNTTTGAITQPAGSAGCVSRTGAGPCADGHALNAPYVVAVSPDGKSVYATSYGSDAVAHLNRNTTTGAISQSAGSNGCVSETGAAVCANGHALVQPFGVAVSADGKSVYVASHVASTYSGAVVRFDRAP